MRKQTERDLQIAVMKYIKLAYPKAMAIHVPNEGKRNPRYAKATGITAGVSDVLVFDWRTKDDGAFMGLAIELKRKPNKPTENQLEFLEAITNRGWYTKVAYSFDEAKEIIDWYLKK